MNMEITVRWTGTDHNSSETCVVTRTAEGSEIEAAVTGEREGKNWRIGYRIGTNRAWETLFLQLEIEFDGQKTSSAFRSDGQGNWTMDGQAAPEFRDCIDVDIALTPFTNTLPINRLGLAVGESREIRVLYIDPAAGETKPLRQRYTKISETRYKYENVPNDFEAVITVDETGLVVDYPGLFARTGREDRFSG